MADRRFKYPLFGVLTVMWAVGVGYGLHQMYGYATTPGATADAPRHLSEATSLELDANTTHMLMFVHPQCPCTKASLRELERLQATLNRTSLETVIIVMTGTDPQLQLDVGLGQLAQRMANVRVIADADGQIARQFRVYTSGHTLLYDQTGTLRFSGGITPSRGHEGDNQGRTLIRRIVLEDVRPANAATPVFGCPLIEIDDHDKAALARRVEEEASSCCTP
ncbi:MAG: hypothetical protein WD294_02105 [Phycisphaeraceae bacterium]